MMPFACPLDDTQVLAGALPASLKEATVQGVALLPPVTL
jgi:hypothetical protein